MEKESPFKEILAFFQSQQTSIPGDPAYNAAFCHVLSKAAAAEEASIWRLDLEGRLHMVFGTNAAPETISDAVLHEGEGITGAAVLSRQTIAVADAFAHPLHNRRVDERIGFRTVGMISAPIICGSAVYGAVNILNHASGGPFPDSWQEHMSAVGTLYALALTASDRFRPCKAAGRDAIASKDPSGHLRSGTVIVGMSRSIQEVLYLCAKAAKARVPVLICGDTGTGKELAARRIHEVSDRNAGPFLDVCCAALTETILESELFGHVRGAFSGAVRDRKGRFLAASGGTLFLDEIGEMSPTCQAKVLRALQENRITPVGSEKSIDCDVRVIAATNQCLIERIKQGRFREDLYYRLCGIEIVMPPLRERMEDIDLLARYFLNKACIEKREGNRLCQAPGFSDEALAMLHAFDWPGNVRQLEQSVLAAVAVCDKDLVEPRDFPLWLHRAMKTDDGISSIRRQETGSPYEMDDNTGNEHAHYMKALDVTRYPGTGRWNLSAAAREVGMARKTFSYRLKKMGIL
jgi:transcriptional regulator with GAF, ATPase, and Fis domain